MISIRPFDRNSVEIRTDVEGALYYQALLKHLTENIPVATDGIICDTSLLLVCTEPAELEHFRTALQTFQFEAQHPAWPILEIPVCYDDSFALDHETLVRELGMSWERIRDIHSRATYRVSMFGFVPGFGYLTGLPEELHMARKSQPALKVPAGSVAIAAEMSGIYPFELPGGWYVVGRTPLDMFDPKKKDPTYLRLGQEIRFTPISRDEFEDYRPGS